MPSFNIFGLSSILLASSCHAFLPSKSSSHHHHIHPLSRPSSHQQLEMFTGIVEEMGTVVSMEERDDMPLWDGSTGKGTELVVEGKVVMDGAYLG
mmetsp:Transcript_26433/g.64411  ORF Transcript_26433/g.64411 Transcript_26433/m.64411 type:complete len:95 (+) Transcript_26433:107-391(+)